MSADIVADVGKVVEGQRYRGPALMCDGELVSVVMANFNGAKYLRSAIASVCYQKYERWELLVVDDGSVDESRQIVRDYAEVDCRVRLIAKDNGGVASARNCGLAAASGEFVAFLDSDDVWSNDHLQRLISMCDSDTLCVAGVWMIDEHGRYIGDYDSGEIDESACCALMRGNPILPSAVLTRADVLARVGGFCEVREIQHAEDWDLWLRLCGEGIKIVRARGKSAYYRRHGNSATSKREMIYSRTVAMLSRHGASASGSPLRPAYIANVTRLVVAATIRGHAAGERAFEQYVSPDRSCRRALLRALVTLARVPLFGLLAVRGLSAFARVVARIIGDIRGHQEIGSAV